MAVDTVVSYTSRVDLRPLRGVVLGCGILVALGVDVGMLARTEDASSDPLVGLTLILPTLAVVLPFILAAFLIPGRVTLLIALLALTVFSIAWYGSVVSSTSSTAALGFLSGPALSLSFVIVLVVMDYLLPTFKERLRQGERRQPARHL